jgi:hypothetical protein
VWRRRRGRLNAAVYQWRGRQDRPAVDEAERSCTRRRDYCLHVRSVGLIPYVPWPTIAPLPRRIISQSSSDFFTLATVPAISLLRSPRGPGDGVATVHGPRRRTRGPCLIRRACLQLRVRTWPRAGLSARLGGRQLQDDRQPSLGPSRNRNPMNRPIADHLPARTDPLPPAVLGRLPAAHRSFGSAWTKTRAVQLRQAAPRRDSRRLTGAAIFPFIFQQHKAYTRRWNLWSSASRISIIRTGLGWTQQRSGLSKLPTPDGDRSHDESKTPPPLCGGPTSPASRCCIPSGDAATASTCGSTIDLH